MQDAPVIWRISCVNNTHFLRAVTCIAIVCEFVRLACFGLLQRVSEPETINSIMRTLLLVAGLATVSSFVQASAAQAEDAAPQAEASWHEGGTLHKASGREWVGATQQNQLATAFDWVMASKTMQAKVAEAGDKDVARAHADKLRQCVNVALSRQAKLYASMPAADIAMTCMITLQL